MPSDAPFLTPNDIRHKPKIHLGTQTTDVLLFYLEEPYLLSSLKFIFASKSTVDLSLFVRDSFSQFVYPSAEPEGLISARQNTRKSQRSPGKSTLPTLDTGIYLPLDGYPKRVMLISLFNLPDEILEHIAHFCSVVNNVATIPWRGENVAKAQGLRALSQTCRRFYQIMTPILYQSVWVTDEESIEKLDRTLMSRPELAQRTREIFIYYYSERDENQLDFQFLTRLPRLRHMCIAYYDFAGYFDMDDEDESWNRIWSQAIQPDFPGLAPLSFLQSCAPPIACLCYISDADKNILLGVINLQDENGETWGISSAWQLFVHPTLEKLTLEYVEMHITARYVEKHILNRGIAALRSTPLRELHFLNSDVTPSGLEILLRYPKNLKVLTLSDPDGYPPLDEHERFSLEKFLQSMSAITSSLEFLEIWDNDSIFRGPAFGLSAFTSLRITDMHHNSFFGWAKDEIGTKEIDETRFKTIIAPNVELMKLRAGGRFPEVSLLEFAKRQAGLCPSLRRLVVQSCCDDDPTAQEWYGILKDSGIDLVFEGYPNKIQRPDVNPLYDYLDSNLHLRS